MRLTQFLPLIGGDIGIVPPSEAHVNQEFLCAIRCFAASDAPLAEFRRRAIQHFCGGIQ